MLANISLQARGNHAHGHISDHRDCRMVSHLHVSTITVRPTNDAQVLSRERGGRMIRLGIFHFTACITRTLFNCVPEFSSLSAFKRIYFISFTERQHRTASLETQERNTCKYLPADCQGSVIMSFRSLYPMPHYRAIYHMCCIHTPFSTLTCHDIKRVDPEKPCKCRACVGITTRRPSQT